MPAPDLNWTVIHPHYSDRKPFHRICRELQRQLAETLTEPLPGDMLVLLHRLERTEIKRHVLARLRRLEEARGMRLSRRARSRSRSASR